MKKTKKPQLKICFAASSGGHYEQLMMLKPLMNKYRSFIVTEKTPYSKQVDGVDTWYLLQVNRREADFPLKLIANAAKAIRILHREKPDVIVTTGVLAVVPLCLLQKLRGGRLVYIESFAKVNGPTETGKFLYRYADRFYVQWPSMLVFYPKAKYVGGIY